MRKLTKGILAVVIMGASYLAGGIGSQPAFIRHNRPVPSEIKATYRVCNHKSYPQDLERQVPLHRQDRFHARSEFDSDTSFGFEKNPLWVLNCYPDYFEVSRIENMGSEHITIILPH